MGKSISMASMMSGGTVIKKEREKVNKYFTLVFKYTEYKDSTYPHVINLIHKITDTVIDYNDKQPVGVDYPKFDLFGLYLDDDNIEAQNIINQEEKNKFEE